MPEVGETYITPRTNPFLLGHEEAEKFLLDAWKNNSLHNSWLFSGIEGIGKATLAYKFARFLLSADQTKKEQYTSLDIPPDDKVFKLVANNSHPDLKIIERDYTDTDRKPLSGWMMSERSTNFCQNALLRTAGGLSSSTALMI